MKVLIYQFINLDPMKCVTSFLTLQRYKVTILLLLDRKLYCLKLTRDYVTTLTNYKGWVATKAD